MQGAMTRQALWIGAKFLEAIGDYRDSVDTLLNPKMFAQMGFKDAESWEVIRDEVLGEMEAVGWIEVDRAEDVAVVQTTPLGREWIAYMGIEGFGRACEFVADRTGGRGFDYTLVPLSLILECLRADTVHDYMEFLRPRRP